MELRQIRYFVALAEQLNFSRAAASLYISQSTLSQQIRKLEEELGVRLVYRDHHSVYLTQEGECFLEKAMPILIDSESLAEEMKQTDPGDGREHFRIGLEEGMFEEERARLQLVRNLRILQKEFPKIIFGLRSLKPDDTTAEVQRGRIEICMNHMPSPDPVEEIERMLLLEDCVYLTTNLPREAPLADCLAFVEKTKLFLLSGYGGVPHDVMMTLLYRLNIHPKIHYTRDIQEILLYAEMGYGGMILSQTALGRYGRGSLRCDKIPQKDPNLVVMQWRRDNENPVLRRMIGLFRDSSAESS